MFPELRAALLARLLLLCFYFPLYWGLAAWGDFTVNHYFILLFASSLFQGFHLSESHSGFVKAFGLQPQAACDMAHNKTKLATLLWSSLLSGNPFVFSTGYVIGKIMGCKLWYVSVE